MKVAQLARLQSEKSRGTCNLFLVWISVAVRLWTCFWGCNGYLRNWWLWKKVLVMKEEELSTSHMAKKIMMLVAQYSVHWQKILTIFCCQSWCLLCRLYKRVYYNFMHFYSINIFFQEVFYTESLDHFSHRSNALTFTYSGMETQCIPVCCVMYVPVT